MIGSAVAASDIVSSADVNKWTCPNIVHLISHSENGIEIQTYCAIIACLVIALYTGRKPTLRIYEMIFYFCGMASEEELLAHLAKLAAQDEARQKK